MMAFSPATFTHAHVYMSASMQGCRPSFDICERLDIHRLAHMWTCMPFSSNVYQKLAHTENPSIILTVTSESTTQGALMIQVCILYHLLNKSSDFCQ